MALNPPLTNDCHMDPLRVAGETFVMVRDGIEFQINVKGMGKLKGEGKLIVTTCRLVLVNFKKNNNDFRAFDLPMALTFSEKFCQPIFGANYWYGKCKPLHNSLPGECEFKIWFMEGGCNRFLHVVRNNMKAIRNNKSGQSI